MQTAFINGQTFSVGEKIKIIGKCVNGWDRNPLHTIYAFGYDEDGKTVYICAKTKIPVVGDIQQGLKTNSYISGVFYKEDIAKY